MSDRARQLIQRFWTTANERDWEQFSSLLHPDLLYLVPQTRERVTGAAGFVEFFRTWPGPWRADIALLIAEPDRAVSTIDFITDGEPMTGITFFEIAAGRITRVTDYWPSPYEPPARATARVERL